MDYGSNPLEIVWIETARLEPNPWNPNFMEAATYKKLRREIEQTGFIAPIMVRPLGNLFQVVDGEHRMRIGRDLALPALPCLVAELTDQEAKIKTLQMNGLRGENDPFKLARLLAELETGIDTENLAALLPWSAEEIRQMVGMAADQAEHEVRAMAERVGTMPELEVFAVMVRPDQHRAIRQAIDRALDVIEADDEGDGLTRVCESYLLAVEQNPGSARTGVPL